MALATAKRIASQLLGSGVNALRIKPDAVKKASDALTREDVRALIKDGSITRVPKFGVSRARAREKQRQKRKGRRRGTGSRKGGLAARQGKRGRWISMIRAERAYSLELLSAGKISRETYRKIYLMAKGGFFTKGRSQMLAYLKDNNLIK